MKLEDFLIQEEGDDSKKLPDGRYAATWDSIGKVWNIGPGLTRGVTKDTVWTQEELKAAETAEFAATRAAVARLVKVPLGENQRTACESLCYNIGEAGFAHSTVLSRINRGDFNNVPAAFRLWNKAHGVVIRGLVKRRADEIRLWEHPDTIPPPPDLKTSANVPQASFGLPLTLFDEQPKENSMLATLGSFLISLLGSDQMQSIFRTALKMGGTALVLKAGGDPTNIDTVIGGAIAAIGMFNSGVAHSSAPTPSAPTS